MSAETDDMELDLVQRRADAAGYYVNRHRNWDPARGTGDLYMQRKKKYRGDENGASILRYSTADEVHAKLGEIEAQQHINLVRTYGAGSASPH
jgi:hypothetical protein